MLFTQDDLSTETIDGKSYLTFQPNTIVYAVPKESSNKIKKAKMGIVWHTTYSGEKLEDMRATFGANISGLRKTDDVYFTDADYRDTSGTVNFNKAETASITKVLSSAGKKFRELKSTFMNELMNDNNLLILVKTFNNVKVREGQKISNTTKHTGEMIKYINAKLQKDIDKIKTEKNREIKIKNKYELISYITKNRVNFKNIFDMQNLLL